MPAVYGGHTYEELNADEVPEGTCDCRVIQVGSLALACEYFTRLDLTIKNVKDELRILQKLSDDIAVGVYNRVTEFNSDPYGSKFVIADTIIEIPTDGDYKAKIYPVVKPK